MPFGWYVIITIALMGASFYLGQTYGQKETKRLEQKVANQRLTIEMQAKTINKHLEEKLKSDVSSVANAIDKELGKI